MKYYKADGKTYYYKKKKDFISDIYEDIRISKKQNKKIKQPRFFNKTYILNNEQWDFTIFIVNQKIILNKCTLTLLSTNQTIIYGREYDTVNNKEVCTAFDTLQEFREFLNREVEKE